jgi:hypothetical protein
MVVMDDEDREFYRWYGPWAPLTPPEVASRFENLTAPWWLVGGWAIESFSGQPRVHEDIDVGFFKADLPAVLAALAPDLCVWSNRSGTLRPLKRPSDLLRGCRQLWVRRDGAGPWLMDLAMTPHDGDTWIHPRDDVIRVRLGDVLLQREDGIRFVRPEIALTFKARRRSRKNDADLDAVLPKLPADRRAWLLEAVERFDPEHPWLARLRTQRALGRPQSIS